MKDELDEKRDRKHQKESAAEAVDAYGRQQYLRGFHVGITVAWWALRMMKAESPLRRKTMADGMRSIIRGAYKEAGVELPDEEKMT